MDSGGSSAASESGGQVRSGAWKTYRSFARLCFVAACLPTVLGVFAKLDWRCDLMTHFVVQSAAAASFFLLLFLIGRDWKPAIAAALMVSVNAGRIAPFLPTATDIDSTASRLRLVSANVRTSNPTTEKFLKFVRDENPDVVLVMEVDERWIRALSALRDRYPHFIESPRSDNFGIALYSRQPTDALELVELAESHVPTIAAKLRWNGQQIALFGAHLLPPMNGEYARVRNAQLHALEEIARAETMPVVVMGDLNITSWSPWFAELQKSGLLRDSREGFGLCASWPTNHPLLAIPIDHLLASRDVQVVSRRLGADIGSDHWPIVAELALTRSRD